MPEQLSRATHVPFLDLQPSHRDLAGPFLDGIAELLETGAFTNGPQVGEFEGAFAAYCGTKHAVGLASGLDALRLALIAAGLAAGDEVVVPANTFVATVEAVTQAGGRPVLVDAQESDYNLDPDATASAITPQTRFVVPVHLYGQLADMQAFTQLARERDIELVEDACQAHGAARDGIRAGSAGRAAAFSFYPGKNLGAFGDAGALVTDDADLAQRVRALREHGQTHKYHHAVEGWTARLDTIQALVLSLKLPLLDHWNEQRRAAARYYLESLEGVGDVRLPPVPEGSDPVWHLFVIRAPRVEALQSFLDQHGVATGRHYPQPIHLTAAYESLGYRRGEFSVAEALSNEVLSLPIYPGIGEAQLDAVVAGVRAFFSRG